MPIGGLRRIGRFIVPFHRFRESLRSNDNSTPYYRRLLRRSILLAFLYSAVFSS